MAEEHDRQAGLLGGDLAVQGPEIADAFRPTVLIGEMAEVGGGGGGSMAPVIIGVDGVARAVQRAGQPPVARAVLREPVGDLHDGARAPIGQPTPAEQALAVAAALEAGCTTLYSEDFQNGRRFDACMIVNPFL